MALYDLGDAVRIGNPVLATESDAFRTLAGTATDPGAVLLTVRKPDDTLLVYGWPSGAADGTLTRESAGRFYFDVTLTLAGVWTYRLAGTGAVVAAAEGALTVQRSTVT